MSLRRNNLLPLYCQPGKWGPSLTAVSDAERKEKEKKLQQERSRQCAEHNVRERKRARKLAEKRKQKQGTSRTANLNKTDDTNTARRRVHLPVTAFPKACQEAGIQISNKLGESDDRVLVKIIAMVDAFGVEQVESLVDMALSIQNTGGEWTHDRSRMRTLGGILFRLAKDAFGPQLKSLILWNVTDCEEDKR